MFNDVDNDSDNLTISRQIQFSENIDNDCSGTIHCRVPVKYNGRHKETGRTQSMDKAASCRQPQAIKKSMKIKLFEKDNEMAKVVRFQFPRSSLHVLNLHNAEALVIEQSVDGQIIVPSISNYKALGLTKFKVLKSYLNSYQQQKKKYQKQDMNVLGLHIQRMDCNRKNSISKDNKKQSVRLIAKGRANQTPQKFRSQFTTTFEETTRHTTINGNQLSKTHAKLVECPRKTTLTNLSASKTDFSKNNPSNNSCRTRTIKVSQGSNLYAASQHNKIYQERISLFQEFIFKVNFAHNVYAEQFKLQSSESLLQPKNQQKYRIWIGQGNNCALIKCLFKRRFWWLIVEEKNNTNFAWTQLKDNNIFSRQKASTVQQSIKQVARDAEESEEQDQPRRSKTSIPTKQRVEFDLLLKKIMHASDEKVYKEAQKAGFMKGRKTTIEQLKKVISKPLLEVEKSELARPQILIHNHLENNFFLGNKKALFYNLKQYYELRAANVFNYIPLTFHIKTGIKDPQYKRFIHYFKRRANHIKKMQTQNTEEDDDSRVIKKSKHKMRNIWIVKPGELSNRGNGITVVDEIYEVNAILNSKDVHTNGTEKTYIIQLYIDRPLLYYRRKFDIRHYMMMTNMFGVTRGYWYNEGYIRTSGYEFDIFNFERQIHLTNDAVQKYTDNYGKYEAGNKLSYAEFQRYLDTVYPKRKYSFERQIIPKMREVAIDAIKSVALKISPSNKQHNFEIFGLDFMVDESFNVWLIEINTNPCLELSCPLLSRIIPQMVEQSLRLTVDVLCPPPCHYSNNNKHLVPNATLSNLKYQLVFDSSVDGQEIKKLYNRVKVSRLMDQIGEISEDQEFVDNGFELKLDNL